jgi:flotillin
MPEIPPIAIGVAGLVLAILLAALLYAKNYVKVPPNQVAVFTGRGKQRIVRGGARFRMPVIERVDIMDLEPFSVQVRASNVYSKDGVPVNVDGVGLIRFGSTDEAISTAVERFLTTPRGTLHEQVQEILTGNLRGIVSQMTVEELNGNRDEFTRRVTEEAGTAFGRIGMELDVLTVQNISDQKGYLDALGRRRAAEVQRDAEIGEAHAQRDAKIAAAQAKQQGDIAQAEADTAIARANRERDIELAAIQAEVEGANARAAQAGPQADAEARKAVVVAEAQAQQARTEAEIQVELLRADRAVEDNWADVVVPADARQQAAVLDAEAARQTTVAEAQADAEATRLAGTADAEARTVAAEASRVELVAAADGERARLLAQADGQAKLAEALRSFDQAALRAQLGPMLIEHLADIVRAAGEPLAGVDSITVLDGGANGSGGLSGFMDQVPNQVGRAAVILRSLGIDLGAILHGQQATEVTANDGDDDVATPAPTSA